MVGIKDMEKTRERFKEHSKDEPLIMDYILKDIKWLGKEVKSSEADNTGLHDWVLYLKDGKECIVEIQKTLYGDSRSGYCRYHDIRLDLISSFDPTKKVKEEFHDWGWRWKLIQGKKDLDLFAKLSKINKWGKLVTCDAHILVFVVMDRKKIINVVKIYDNKKLIKNKDYFVKNYPVKINWKVGEPWGSAFIPVSEDDKVLYSCEINSLKELKKILN